MQVGWDVGWSDPSYQMPGDAMMPVFRLSSARVQTKPWSYKMLQDEKQEKEEREEAKKLRSCYFCCWW